MNDFSWGDTVCLREALFELLGTKKLLVEASQDNMGYTSHHGDAELLELIRDTAERQSGVRFKHIVLTNGATGALNIAIRALRTVDTDYVVTGKTYFSFYPGIVAGAGLTHIDYGKMKEYRVRGVPSTGFLVVNDSPSNPEGFLKKEPCDIWDAAYASEKYGGGPSSAPESYKIMCGSLSKTLGVNGIRLGWAATNDDSIAEALSKHVTFEYCGLAKPQMDLAKQILGHKKFDWDKFEKKAKQKIEKNRAEWAKVAKAFNQPVYTKGMFQLFVLSEELEASLIKAEVKWTPGPSFGGGPETIRISLGQSYALTKDTVKKILR
jgi:aspartate/methionine/tyrosine aminotransferase